MQIFSPNMLKTFQECPKKYEYKYIQKISVPIYTSIYEKGKKIHALAHYYLRGDDIDKFIPTLSEDERQIWFKLLNNEYFKKKYVNSEYNLTMRLSDFWIGGRLDAFMKDENNYYILDYKTGSVPQNPDNDFQTIIYLLCANEILKKGWGENFNLFFVYIDLKNNANLKIDFDNSKKLGYEEKIINTCKKLTTTQIFLKNTDSCKFCEYKKFCN